MTAYGIDLGTTNSCISYIDENNQPQIVRIPNNGDTLPSVVYYNKKGEILVGAGAKNQSLRKPEDSVIAIKRSIGDKKYSRTINGVSITPEGVSSEILKKLVTEANKQREDAGKQPIFDVVITIPANYDHHQKASVNKAAGLAGLKVIKLVTEPTAAALSYGIRPNIGNRIIIVYDLGGGTFDVSILKIENGSIDTITTAGEPFLGGLDWDKSIIEDGLKQKNLSYNKEYWETEDGCKALDSAERAKQDLTDMTETSFSFTHNGETYNIDDYERDSFVTQTQMLVNKTIQCLVSAAIDAEETKNVSIISKDRKELIVDDIILVGGSSRMPMIEEALSRRFSNAKDKIRLMDPDLAIAKGAAIAATVELEVINKKPTSFPSVGIKDIISHSYGIEVVDDHNVHSISNIIKKNENIPVAKRKHQFKTRLDDQKQVQISVYSNKDSANNVDMAFGTLLKSGYIDWGTPVPKNTPIDVYVSINNSGLVEIEATAKGKTINFDIND